MTKPVEFYDAFLFELKVSATFDVVVLRKKKGCILSIIDRIVALNLFNSMPTREASLLCDPQF